MRERRMTTAAKVGKGPLRTTDGVLGKEPVVTVDVPIKDIEDVEGIALGFRQEMFNLSDDDKVLGGMATGAGWGTDVILLEWGKKKAVVSGRSLLKAWVATFAPKDAERMP